MKGKFVDREFLYFNNSGGSAIEQEANRQLGYNPDQYRLKNTDEGGEMDPSLLDIAYKSKQQQIKQENELNEKLASKLDESMRNYRRVYDPENQAKVAAQRKTSEQARLRQDPNSVLQKDIARSCYFTVLFDNLFSKSQFTVPVGPSENIKGGYAFNKDKFLPVKSISVNYGSIESISVPIACYSDVPIMSKRKVGKITLGIYDYDDDSVELALKEWMHNVTINGRTVYLDESYLVMHYKSYNVKGILNTTLDLLVTPIGDISVSRSYESNEAKIVTVSMAIVGMVNDYWT